jgi:transcriptional regulator with XRE-family HTH domain
MPKASKLQLMPLPHSEETPGQRLARIRRERGFTQIELAEKTGMVQTLVSDYERGNALLQPAGPVESRKPSRKVLRHLEQIEALPLSQQSALLRTIDTLLEGAAARAARRG